MEEKASEFRLFILSFEESYLPSKWKGSVVQEKQLDDYPQPKRARQLQWCKRSEPWKPGSHRYSSESQAASWGCTHMQLF